MTRRDFLQTTTALPLTNVLVNPSKAPGKLLNAYYFRAHLYTLVPKHVREDLAWMADQGTDAVSVAVLEQDLTAAVENINFIAEEAAKRGMQTWAVPSRWAGLLAGAPKVPSVFSVQNPQTWMLDASGKPYSSAQTGVISSVQYPETFRFFQESLEKLVNVFPGITGVVWDELKMLGSVDYSPKALEKLPASAPLREHVKAKTDFFSRVNQHLKEKHPKLQTSAFIYADSNPLQTELVAQITPLDYVGCDGRPWPSAWGGQMESAGKSISDEGPRFIETAKKFGKKNLLLIENHNLPARDIDLMDRGLADLIQLPIDQLVYYYYPRNIGDPERNMAVVGKWVKKWR